MVREMLVVREIQHVAPEEQIRSDRVGDDDLRIGQKVCIELSKVSSERGEKLDSDSSLCRCVHVLKLSAPLPHGLLDVLDALLHNPCCVAERLQQHLRSEAPSHDKNLGTLDG